MTPEELKRYDLEQFDAMLTELQQLETKLDTATIGAAQTMLETALILLRHLNQDEQPITPTFASALAAVVRSTIHTCRR